MERPPTPCDAHACDKPATRTIAWVEAEHIFIDEPLKWDRTYECREHAIESFRCGPDVFPGYRPVVVMAGIRPMLGGVVEIAPDML